MSLSVVKMPELSKVTVLETKMISTLRRFEGPRLTAAMRFVTHMGDAKSWVVLSLALALFDGRVLSPGIGIGFGALCGAMVAKAVKIGIRRQRPHLNTDGLQTLVDVPDAYSFPSGHTTTAFCVFGLIAATGSSFVWAWMAFAIAVAFSRVYLGVHFPSDVLVGALLGVLCSGVIGIPLLPFFH